MPDKADTVIGPCVQFRKVSLCTQFTKCHTILVKNAKAAKKKQSVSLVPQLVRYGNLVSSVDVDQILK